MGDMLLQCYRTKIKKEHKVAFVATFIVAMLIHMYKFSNTLQNHDSVFNFYADQNLLPSGRWALSFFAGFSSYFDLPWLLGVVSCFMIALTTVVIVALFDMKNPVLIVLTGALIAASPATTETFFFLYTADAYMISMFLSAIAVYLSRMGESRPLRWIVSGVCICVSCGIYQAYLTFSFMLTACYLIVQLLDNRCRRGECFKWLLLQLIMYVVSLAAFYVIWKMCMHFSGMTPESYQGIDQVGTMNIGLLFHGFISSAKIVIQFFLGWNVFKNGFTVYAVLNLIFLCFFAISLIVAVIKSDIWKRKWAMLLLLLCIAAMVPLVGIWNFTSDSLVYRPMMLQSLTLLFVFAALLFETWTGKIFKNTAALLLVAVIINNSVLANISYYHMNLCQQRTYAESAELMLHIHNYQREYDVEKIAFIGDRSADLAWEMFDEKTGDITGAGKAQFLTMLLETNLLSDHRHCVAFLNSTYGLGLIGANEEKLTELSALPGVQELGCWPTENCITVVDDILVIKLADVLPVS